MRLIVWFLMISGLHGCTMKTGFTGTFTATMEGEQTELVLVSNNGSIAGTCSDYTGMLPVSGSVNGNMIKGSFNDYSGSPLVSFTGELIDNTTLTLVFDTDGQTNTIVFRRKELVSTQPHEKTVAGKNKTGSLDQRVVGRWSKQDIINSSGSSHSSVKTFVFYGDGRYEYYVRSVGGGTDWSHLSGDPELIESGTWRTVGDNLYFQANGSEGEPLKYQFYEGKLVFGNKNFTIWYPEK